MGSPFAEGYVQKCLSTLKQCSKEFVYRSYLKNFKELDTSQTKEVNEDQIESKNQEDNFYSDFFNEVPIQTPRMNDEAIKFKFTTELDKEISALTLVISSANFSKDKKSLPEFWSKNSSSLPILCSLAKVLINISSSSAFIELFLYFWDNLYPKKYEHEQRSYRSKKSFESKSKNYSNFKKSGLD